MVPTERLELSRPKSQPPQGCVSTNSTTTAMSLSSNVITILVYLLRQQVLLELASELALR